MNLFRPPKPHGSDAQWSFLRAVWDMLWGGKFPFRNSTTVKFTSHADGGYSFHAEPPRGPAATPAPQWFPFRIYVFPSDRRETPDADTDWLKFRVRSGRVVGNVSTPVWPSGTDDADNPDSGIIAEDDVADITVTSGEGSHWFWIEIDEEGGTATIENDATPPAEWTTTVIPIGWVNASGAFATAKTADIQQLLRTDAIIPCLEFP